MRSTTHHRTLIVFAVAPLVTVLAAGCGQGPADRREAELKNSTAEVVDGARAYTPATRGSAAPGSSTMPGSTPSTGGSTGSPPSTTGAVRVVSIGARSAGP